MHKAYTHICMNIRTYMQVGKIPIIQVWSSENMQTLVTLRGFHEMGIASVKYIHTYIHTYVYTYIHAYMIFMYIHADVGHVARPP